MRPARSAETILRIEIIAARSHMKTSKRKRLEAAGWKVGPAKDFLGLTPEEAAFVELKLTLSASLKERRQRHGLSQSDLAKPFRSNQSRVAQNGSARKKDIGQSDRQE